jgi:KEOPS complex subunit Cgi121
MDINENIPEIRIMGFKSEIVDVMTTLNQINQLIIDDSYCTIQLLDARGLAGKEHILHATVHAINAFKRKNNIAHDLGMEICVRASAQRQISRAIEILGLKKGLMDICVVMVGCPPEMEDHLNSIFERDDSVLDGDTDFLKGLYGLENEEIELMGGVVCTLLERTTALILDA